MARFEISVFLLQFFPNSLPQAVAVGHGIRLVAHAHALQSFASGVFESVPNNALDPFARIHVLLHSNLVWHSLLEISAHSCVSPFGIFAKHDEVDLALGAIAQWRESLVKEDAWARVHVQVELESQSQQNIRRVLI